MNSIVHKNIPVLKTFYQNLIQNGKQQNVWGPWPFFSNSNVKQELPEAYNKLQKFLSEHYEKIVDRSVLPHAEIRKQKLTSLFSLVKILEKGLDWGKDMILDCNIY